MTLAYRSARGLAAEIAAGRLSARDALEFFVDRADRLDGPLNAIIVRDLDGARARADAVDAARARGAEIGVLGGVPMTVKESFDYAGLPSTWGVPLLRDNIAARHSVAVERLLRAGANVWGKTNVPRLLADWQSYNEIYGTTSNPWDVTRTPGGSSGGSGVSLAAGFSPLELGTDIGGSVRVPAHFNGVYGHKPTWGIIPMRGHAPPGILTMADISVAGPLARSVDDLELALDILAGPDLLQSPGWRLELPPPRRPGAEGLRVALWLDDPRAPSDAGMAARLEEAATALARAGAVVSDTARPAIDLDEAFDTYCLLLTAVTNSRLPEADFQALLTTAARLDPADRGFFAHNARGGTLRHRDWLQHNERRTRLRWAWHAFFQDWDVLLCPVTPTPAFPQDQGPEPGRRITINNTRHDYYVQLYWAGLFGVAYLPGTAAPVGRVDGLPVGIQIVGPELGDRTTLQVARLLERLIGGFQPPPGYA